MANIKGVQKVKLKPAEAPELEFFLMTNPGMASKWRHDRTIPLIDVVENFDIYLYVGTKQPHRPSKSELEKAFGTSEVDTIIKLILEKGEIEGEHHKGNTTNKNHSHWEVNPRNITH
eukprot:TRINITY_DN3308_c0_g1_i3.p1 TRINITY_DN3308_c0_g1~~TRINITY_DN3308_c0_g1_i3.p1  ORF type:complete len:117 (-),score=28.29 TRINITY_DN3308_c0_g1_i3:81-431(-)